MDSGSAADWTAATFAGIALIGSAVAWWQATRSKRAVTDAEAAAKRAERALAAAERSANAAEAQAGAMSAVANSLRPPELTAQWEGQARVRLRNTTDKAITITEIVNSTALARSFPTPLTIGPGQSTSVRVLPASGYRPLGELVVSLAHVDGPHALPLRPA